MVGLIRIHTRQYAYISRWHHAGYQGAKFVTDQYVHYASFVGSAEDKWTALRIKNAYGYALDADILGDVRKTCVPI